MRSSLKSIFYTQNPSTRTELVTNQTFELLHYRSYFPGIVWDEHPRNTSVIMTRCYTWRHNSRKKLWRSSKLCSTGRMCYLEWTDTYKNVDETVVFLLETSVFDPVFFRHDDLTRLWCPPDSSLICGNSGVDITVKKRRTFPRSLLGPIRSIGSWLHYVFCGRDHTYVLLLIVNR